MTIGSAWPTGGDYAAVVQYPADCFTDAELRTARVATSRSGLPIPYSGQFGLVFQVRSQQGRRVAVKCFTGPATEALERYAAISRALSKTDAKSRWAVGFEYQTAGILVGGRRYPLLKMEWVDGLTLARWLDQHINDAPLLRAVAKSFLDVCADMWRMGIAHCDLQHGNVLVTAAGSVKLIDYDGMYVPDLSGRVACERGHRNYQHPQRTNEFGPRLDAFAIWVIWGALIALACDPGLWQRYGGGDERLLLGREDLANPARSQLVRELLQSGDSELSAVGRAWRDHLSQPLGAVPVHPAVAASDVAARPWWRDTGASNEAETTRPEWMYSQAQAQAQGGTPRSSPGQGNVAQGTPDQLGTRHQRRRQARSVQGSRASTKAALTTVGVVAVATVMMVAAARLADSDGERRTVSTFVQAPVPPVTPPATPPLTAAPAPPPTAPPATPPTSGEEVLTVEGQAGAVMRRQQLVERARIPQCAPEFGQVRFPGVVVDAGTVPVLRCDQATFVVSLVRVNGDLAARILERIRAKLGIRRDSGSCAGSQARVRAEGTWSDPGPGTPPKGRIVCDGRTRLIAWTYRDVVAVAEAPGRTSSAQLVRFWRSNAYVVS